MKTPRDRGEYRPVFEALYDGPDYHRLSGVARSVLIAIKVKLPGWGIGVLPALDAQAAYWTGFSAEHCAVALEELAREDWIRREGAVVWLVRGLEFEPTRSSNDPKHRTALASHLQTLPSVALLVEFRQHYQAWLKDTSLEVRDEASAEAPASPDTASAGASEALGRAIEGPSEGDDTASAGASEALATPPPPPEPTPTAPPPPAADRAAGGSEHDRRPASRWPQLHAKLPATGVHRQQVSEFLATVPEAKANAWCAILLNALAGVDTPGGAAVSADQLVAAIAEYEAKLRGDHNPALFHGCLATVLKRRWSGQHARNGDRQSAAADTSGPTHGRRLRRLTGAAEEAAGPHDGATTGGTP